MFKKKIFALSLILCSIFFSFDAHALGKISSCYSLWGQDIPSVKKDKKAEENLLLEAKSFVSEQTEIFKKHHPELYFPELDTIAGDENKLWILLVNACPKSMHMKGPLSVEIQKTLYRTYNFAKQAKNARDNGCKLTRGKSMELFNMGDGIIDACSNPYTSASISINKDSSGGSLRICPSGTGPGYNIKPPCFDIKPTKEHVCLSEFGSCEKNSAGECEWVSTPKSSACIK